MARLYPTPDGTCIRDEVEKFDLSHPTLSYVSDPGALRQADFYIVTVPTPIEASRRPDLTAIYAASETVGRFLKCGDIVVYESTVYPGAVEEDCVPEEQAASAQFIECRYSPPGRIGSKLTSQLRIGREWT